MEFLKDIFEEFEHGEDEIDETDVPEQDAEDLEDDLDDGLEAIEICKSALERLARYAEDKDPEHLRRGLARMAKGLTELAEIAARNELALRRIEGPLPISLD